MKKLSKVALQALDEVQAVNDTILARYPEASSEAIAILTQTVVNMVNDAGEDILDG